MQLPNSPAKRRGLAALVGAVAAAALFAFTPAQEGRSLPTYRDIGGVLTYCDGATENAVWGKVYTPAECDAQLDRDLARHAEGINACMPLDRLTVGQRIAFVDAAYNVGVANFCSSSMAKRANAGDVLGSCTALFEWNGIVKKVPQPDGTVKRIKVPVKGLVLRRLRAIEICLTRK